MATFIVCISFLSIIIGVVVLIKTFIKKQAKKNGLLLIGISFITMIGAALFIPTRPQIELSEKSVETDKQGVAIIKGKTNAASQITVAGETIKTHDGKFSYTVTLEENHPKKITFIASIGKYDQTEIFEVKPSNAFMAFLKEKKMNKKEFKPPQLL